MEMYSAGELERMEKSYKEKMAPVKREVEKK